MLKWKISFSRTVSEDFKDNDSAKRSDFFFAKLTEIRSYLTVIVGTKWVYKWLQILPNSRDLAHLYKTEKMLLCHTIPTSPITAPAKSGKASYFKFAALGRDVSLLLRPIFDQNKQLSLLQREQKRSEIRPILGPATFNCFV